MNGCVQRRKKWACIDTLREIVTNEIVFLDIYPGLRTMEPR